MILLILIISMVFVLFLVSKKVNIGLALIGGSIMLSLLSGRPISYILNTFYITLKDSTTLLLASTVLLITILGYLMDKLQIMDRMICSLENMLRGAKLTILIAPAIIGTLLVTGGALMSCPVVDKLGDRLDISKGKRAAINLIFRHALYFIFPLSTTIIMASKLGDFNVMDFVKLQFPISLVMYTFGYFVYLQGYTEPKVKRVDLKGYLASVRDFFLYASPILVSLFGVIIFKIPFPLSLSLGILIALIINIFDKKHNPKYSLNEGILKTMYKGIKPVMVIAIFGIMYYKNVVADMDELYVQLNSFLERGIPIELLIIIASFMIALPMGSTQPAIAILFPMVLPLAPDYHTKLVYAMFIYTSSFLFYYISPLHLCQVLTLEYFQVKIKELYKYYYALLPLTYATMVIIYIFNIYLL